MPSPQGSAWPPQLEPETQFSTQHAPNIPRPLGNLAWLWVLSPSKEPNLMQTPTKTKGSLPTGAGPGDHWSSDLRITSPFPTQLQPVLPLRHPSQLHSHEAPSQGGHSGAAQPRHWVDQGSHLPVLGPGPWLFSVRLWGSLHCLSLLGIKR